MKETVSIIIPVLNEAETIGRTISQFQNAAPKDAGAEIIVVDGDMAGSTLRAVKDPGVITAVSPRGRASQMNHGAGLASGSILLFLHADTLLPPEAPSKIAAALSGARAEWGAFDLGIASSRLAYRIIEASVRIRTAVTRIPYGDQAIFLTRDLFHRAGGFPPIPIMEDVALMRRIRKLGAAGCRIPEKVATSPRRWQREGILYCTLRNWLLVTCFFLGARPEILAKYYRSK